MCQSDQRHEWWAGKTPNGAAATTTYITEAVVSNTIEVAEKLLRESAGQERKTSVTDETATDGPKASVCKQTRLLTSPTQQIPRVHAAAVPRVEK